jgi:hypothetical protein
MTGKSLHSWIRPLFLALLILNGLIFVASLPALIDPDFALRIHSDLYPESGMLMIFLKSVICFLSGVTYLIAAYGYYHRSLLVFAGVLGSVPFFLLYLVELSCWGTFYLPVWVGFMTFGLASLIIMTGSYLSLKSIISEQK